MRVPSGAWWALLVLAAAASMLMLIDAGRDLATSATFSGLLRLVIEAIAAAVLLGFCLGRARSRRPRSGGAGRDGAGGR